MVNSLNFGYKGIMLSCHLMRTPYCFSISSHSKIALAFNLPTLSFSPDEIYSVRSQGPSFSGLRCGLCSYCGNCPHANGPWNINLMQSLNWTPVDLPNLTKDGSMWSLRRKFRFTTLFKDRRLRCLWVLTALPFLGGPKMLVLNSSSLLHGDRG